MRRSARRMELNQRNESTDRLIFFVQLYEISHRGWVIDPIRSRKWVNPQKILKSRNKDCERKRIKTALEQRQVIFQR